MKKIILSTALGVIRNTAIPIPFGAISALGTMAIIAKKINDKKVNQND